MHNNPKPSLLKRALSLPAIGLVLLSGLSPLVGQPVLARSGWQAPQSAASPNESDTTEGTWTPGAGTSFTLPLSSTSITITVDAVVSFTPNLNSAAYFVYDPASGSTFNYSASATAISGGARITGAAIPFIASGQEVWFSISSAGGTTDYSPHYKIYRQMNLYIPLLSKPGLLEPNDTACTATSTVANTSYTGQNDDQNDWFAFTAPANTVVSVTLTGIQSLAYAELYYGSDCSSASLMKVVGLPASSSTVFTQSNLTTTTYYVHILSVIQDKREYNFSWTYANRQSELEPNNTACTATSATVGQTYSGRDDDAQDWFMVTVPTTTSLVMTVTGFAGSGVMQFFPATSPNCASVVAGVGSQNTALSSAATAFTANNLVPGTYYVLIVSTSNSNQLYTFSTAMVTSTLNSFEPNNGACAAQPINLDTQYQSYVNDDEDWYYIDLAANNSLNNGLAQFIITNVPTRSNSSYSQPNLRIEVEIWRSNSLTTTNPSCTDIRRLDSEGNWANIRNRASKGNYWLEGVQELPSDRYYLRVFVRQDADTGANPPYSGPAYNVTEPYKFWVTRGASGVASPRFYPGPCELCGGIYWGSDVPFYWWGMTGGTFNFQLLGRDCTGGGTKTCGCPQGANTGITNSSGEFGKGTYGGIGQGYYALRIVYNGPAFTYTWTDEKPVKVQCEFGADVQVDEKGWPLTDPIAHPENFTAIP